MEHVDLLYFLCWISCVHVVYLVKKGREVSEKDKQPLEIFNAAVGDKNPFRFMMCYVIYININMFQVWQAWVNMSSFLP